MLAVTGGLSCYTLTHSDVGGYPGFNLAGLISITRSRELLMRWAELNAFSGAVFRSHEGILPLENHQPWSDAETLEHFRRSVTVSNGQ